MRLSLILLIALAQISRPDEQAELQKLREELSLNEEKIEILRRILPPEFDRAEEEKSFRKLAQAAHLENLKIRFPEETPRLPLEDGTPSPLVMHEAELSGRDSFQDLYLFLSMLEHRPRFARLETLRINAAESATVRFSARIVLPVVTDDPQPEPPVRDGMLASTRHRVARKRAIVSALSKYLDPARRENVPDVLAALEAEIGTRPIALTGTEYDGSSLTLRGVVVGAAARDSIRSALEKAGLRSIRQNFSREGICQGFTIAATPQAGDVPPQAVIGNGLFDAGARSICKPALAPSTGQIVAGSSSPDSPPPFLQLRDVDLADVFAALGDLLPEAFVVNQDVTGRVLRVDVFDNASLTDVLNATATATGVRIGAGPIRPVARAPHDSSWNTTENPGAPVSFTIKDAAITDVLCLFGQITESEILGPPDQSGRLSIFAVEAPVNQLLAAVIDTTSLASAREGPRLILRKRGDSRDIAGVNVCEIPTPGSSSRLALLPASLHELGLADIELVGLARLSESWKGYIYGPARRLMPLEAGYELFDATVKSVGPEGVTLTRRDGKVVALALPE